MSIGGVGLSNAGSFHVEQSFAARLAYLRFLKHLESGKHPTNVDIGRAADLSGEAVTQWIARDSAPTGYSTLKALVAYFEIPEGETWLVEGRGPPPRPTVWELWSAARRGTGAPNTQTRAQQIMDEMRARGFERLTDKSETPAAQALTKPSAPKKAADGGKRGRRGR
jgi:hypothetical protein